jgi:uncharacterized protein YodC (DUF2158 family)
MEPIKVGSIVCLISGGPEMTVTEFVPDTPAPANIPGSDAKPARATCMWFCKDEAVHQHPCVATFPPAALEILSTPEDRAEKKKPHHAKDK